MGVFQLLLLLFVLVPLVEIYLLIQVGGVIGALPTIALVVLTAVLGAGLMRVQGLSTLARAQASLDRGEIPATELLEGVLILMAGAVLLTPGFVTDAIGFVLLVPPWRAALARHFLARRIVHFRGHSRGSGPGAGGARRRPGGRGRVIEGEYREDQPRQGHDDRAPDDRAPDEGPHDPEAGRGPK